jgi:hypothetical protein
VEPELISNELKNDLIRVVGFLVNVSPKSTVEIKINYQLNQFFKKGKGLYQLIVQKQIGSDNNDLVLEISLPKNYYLLNQNYLPLVKDNQILYNTNLTTDKIFLTELIKE